MFLLPCRLCLRARTGVYIAVHPWLNAAGFIKIGFSTDLDTRLEMSAFTTCFTPEWVFVNTYECESRREAMLLEQATLYCFHNYRVPQRELLRLKASVVDGMIAKIAERLNIHILRCTYAPTSTSFVGPPPATVDDSENGTSGHSNDLHTRATLCSESTLPSASKHIDELQVLPGFLTSEIDTPLLIPFLDTLNDIRHNFQASGAMNGGCALPMKTSETVSLDCSEYDIVEYTTLCEENYEFTALRSYQAEAVDRVKKELRAFGKAICQMACRCGKTAVAFQIIKDALCTSPSTTRILYLVPGLALLRQTARKLYSYGLHNITFLLIGSDSTPLQLDNNVSISMTTNVQIIDEFLRCNHNLIVLSTYHSSPMVAAFNVFDITIFDECHRVCGSLEASTFNTILRSPQHGSRLFLTATPTYDTPISMSDKNLFGGVAYRYYLREGIDAGFVNPFDVRIILGTTLQDMRPYIYEAMRLVDKMLVFCRNIEHAEELFAQLKSGTTEDVPAFKVFIAHSRMRDTCQHSDDHRVMVSAATALAHFVSETRCVMLNVRLFQEGVEIPDLNAVFFAAPRYSPRDIIQSICRPLNRLANKPRSFVFLPAVYNPSFSDDHPVNLQSYATLVPFTDALMDEDPALFEYMIDPQNKSYDLSVVGVRSLKLSNERLKEFVLPAVRRGVRYTARSTDRLQRAGRLPWKYIFGEMKRVVLQCNRYPKTNDAWVVGNASLSLSTFYRYVRRGYELHLQDEPTYLQTYQIRDLESLPYWSSYGVYGPYPWRECINTLEKHLAEHGKVPPLEVHKGGYIGLDATPFERLSGCLMGVNQSDARLSLRLSSEKQADLDRICLRYNLKWRKKRDTHGVLLPNEHTFITSSYEQFKFLYKNISSYPLFKQYLNYHFPGYPHKHNRMECIHNLQKDTVPPRHTPKKMQCAVDDPSAHYSPRRTVMCRVCRTHISVDEWDKHLTTEEHAQNQQGLTVDTPLRRSI